MLTTTSPYMARALALARRARGRTSPNPAVGAVIVRDGVVVGEGFTQPAGSWHAEVMALRQAGEAARGASLYVTLEPCCHYGRTPPCTQALMAAGVAEVHLAMVDPNPLVGGGGQAALEAAGIPTTVGEGQEEALEIVEGFVKFIATQRPHVTAKFAMSLDGKIATRSGQSRWISGEESRRLVHHLRDRVDAVLVGVGTALADDPLLTVRLPASEQTDGRQPLRVVVDSHGRLPMSARLLGKEASTLVATTAQSAAEWREGLAERGADVLVLPAQDGHVDLRELLVALGQRGLTSTLVEGGGTLLGAFFSEGLVDKVMAFIAPLVIGGKDAPSPVGGRGADALSEALRLSTPRVERIGEDVLVIGKCLPE